ncbi:MAG: hypothetical protein COW19_01970 [Zetaproteobacteria bacterium CG12_big_fil_rev_8_21_14_0_65_55_1124]|nr:MAG: hypothetical protein AUJ58_10095 [Zetaproteobacteria bacterium CG1_02_55_237]PIS19944.1 MAG: hypothetical protein COT53_02840 [Zetaproteobacteria bacterium CG08_land_8_20_14_0_20_55_17]PIW43634.1 MAG: hypothetical protein COW19_01970 [Zetaproteobacteria bacterium CG12_big_fil_rev_8_21_14_0_65_55_1124]PIY52698.1 MAG: hypothetical protein COZ01_06615 [Zetaproteobacteria bacterium CG_4_10_14_0_8_um_filter_55_43]PIZ37882.1 MAG: hypothetical protein COY36_07955 [Zetaproteobacteria bacterium 
MFEEGLPDFLVSGEKARLIPVGKESNKERNVASVFLSAISAVDEFGKELLKEIGAPINSRSKIHCYTEVVFKEKIQTTKDRPDGLIVVEYGKTFWMALVEAKIGNAPLNKEQIETYLDIARTFKVNALITVSNQFASLPTHHPIQVDKRKIKTVSLYHWSWTSIVANALLLASNKSISDPDQAFILEELLRFLRHPNSGVLSFTRMGPEWKDVCQAVLTTPLKKHAPEVESTVSTWHQLVKYLALEMSVATSNPVAVYMSRNHKESAQNYMQAGVTSLVDRNELESQFVVPNTAGRIKLVADIKGRTLVASMRLDAPKDKQQVKSRVAWLVRQLSKCADTAMQIKIIWPNRSADDVYCLTDLREEKVVVTPPSAKALPNAFEVMRVYELAGRFAAPKVFVEEAEKILPDFYENAGQHLRAWIAPPPKIKPQRDEEDEDNRIKLE